MLDSFLIKNFRLFKSFELKHLSRLNLFVGKNNSGKSALLEAVRLYACNAAPYEMLSLIADRQETWKGRRQVSDQDPGIHPVRHLFHNRTLPEPGKEGIVLGPISPTAEQLQIQVAGYRYDREGSEIPRTILVELESLEDLQDIELALVAREGGKDRRILWLGDEPDRHTSPRQMRFIGMDQRCPIMVVPAQNMTEGMLAALWDQIGLTDLGEAVLSGLRLVEPTITGAAFVEGPEWLGSNYRLPLFSSENAPEPLPLKSLGDGIMRLFHIIVALVNA